MQAEYGARYRDLYEHHWWWRAREAAVLETLATLKPPGGWARILDVGCGDGLFFDRLLELGDVEGVEPSSELVNPAGTHRQRIHVCPFDEGFAPANRYSLILMLDVLEHLDDPAAALRHAISLLSPEGWIVITVPAFNLLWTSHDVINQHRTRYRRATFREVARQAGLRIDLERYWFQWTFPAKLAQGIVERVANGRPAPPRVPPRWLNRLLYELTRLEYRVFRRLSPPFGSSLLVAGRVRPSSGTVGG